MEGAAKKGSSCVQENRNTIQSDRRRTGSPYVYVNVIPEVQSFSSVRHASVLDRFSGTVWNTSTGNYMQL